MSQRNKYSRQWTITALDVHNKNSELNIPQFQRELVWTKSQKQLLIDSILKDYDIPKLYFREIYEKDKIVYDVIDGQQRVMAILDFIHNEYPMPKDADPVKGENIKNKFYKDLSSDLQSAFMSKSLDVVHLQNYSSEEIEETFLRLQNGTPLRAAEKRRAIGGKMRDVINELSNHKFFKCKKICDFDDSHFAYEDIATKVLKQLSDGLSGGITAHTLEVFYEENKKIDINDSKCKSAKSAFNFLVKAFSKGHRPHLKKYAAIDLPVIVNGMLELYDLSLYPDEFGKVYLQFLNVRAKNNEKSEDKQDQDLLAYNNATRSDSVANIKFRQEYLRNYFIVNMPYLVVKDKKREFTEEQRAAIYRLGKGKCAKCGKKVDENSEFHADHKKPYSRGGKTCISNGQILCRTCNLKKGNRLK